MRKTRRNGGFFVCLFFNLLLNLEGIVPAILLLVLHFVLDWSVWWAVLAFVLWVLGIVFWMKFMGWASDCGNTPDPPKPNKNPYSETNRDVTQGDQ